MFSFSQQSPDSQLAFVLALQQKRQNLLEQSQHRRKTARKPAKPKKPKTFQFSDPSCQAMFDMMPEEFKLALLAKKKG